MITLFFRIRLLRILLHSTLVSLLICSTCATANTENHTINAGQPLILGVAPFMSPLALSKRMAPLRNYLTKRLNRQVIFETTIDAREYAKRSLEGRYDLLLTNPTFALVVLNKGNYALQLSQVRPLSGMLIVMKDSPITTIEQLAGKKIGAPPKIGFLGQLAEPYFKSQGLNNEKAATIINFHSHNDAVSALRLKTTDATFIASFMKTHLVKKGMQIRTIVSTADFPGLCILTNNRVPTIVSNTLNIALLELGQSDEGKALLKKISMPAFRTIEEQELDIVKPYLPTLVES